MKDASAIFRDQVEHGDLERLSALETLKRLRNPESVSLADLVGYLSSRGLWSQFAKITLGDLRDSFAEPARAPEGPAKKKKRRILEDELGDALDERAAASRQEADDDGAAEGGMSREEVSRLLLPFIEGNGDVTFQDLEDYSRIDRKELRRHLAALVKEGRLERIGVGRHAVYTAV